MYVGGAEAGDRLAQVLRADVPLADVPALLRPLLERFNEQSATGIDSFGDWCASSDLTELQSLLPEPTGRRRGAKVAAETADE